MNDGVCSPTKEEAGQLVALRHQIDEELARTQRLLQALCQRIVGDRQVGALRNLLTDVSRCPPVNEGQVGADPRNNVVSYFSFYKW